MSNRYNGIPQSDNISEHLKQSFELKETDIISFWFKLTCPACNYDIYNPERKNGRYVCPRCNLVIK